MQNGPTWSRRVYVGSPAGWRRRRLRIDRRARVSRALQRSDANSVNLQQARVPPFFCVGTPMSSDAAQGPTDEQKSALVERILCGEISAEEACRERGLSESELKEWVSAHRRIARRTQEERLSAALSARGLPHDDV